MPDATPTLGPKPHASLFTRLAAVEPEVKGLKDLVASLKADHDAMRKDRDEWRWRAERLLADLERGFLGRMSSTVETAFGRVIGRLWTLVRSTLVTVLQAVRRGPFRFVRPKLDEPRHDATVALAGTAHSPHPVDDGGLDLDEALVSVPLQGPSALIPSAAWKWRHRPRLKGRCESLREPESVETVI
jgi:hypothetical protein